MVGGGKRSRGSLAVGRMQLGLGDIYRILQDDDKAEKALQEAVAVLEPMVRRETSAGTASHYLSVALNCLAYIDCNQGRYDLAEPRLRQALKLCVAINGWENFKTAKVLDTFVRLYGEQGRWRDAEQYCRAEIEVYEKSVGKEYVETNEAYMRLAQVLNAQHKYAEAAALMPPVILRYEREFGTDNPRTASAAEVLARILWIQDKFAEAEPLLKKSLAATEKTYGVASNHLAKGLILLALLKTSQGDAAESLRILDRLADIHQQQPLLPQELEHMHLARANALWLSGQRDAAVVELDKSLAQVEFESGNSSGTERERAEMFESFFDCFALAIHWQAERKDVAKLFLAVERAKARSFLDELRLKNVDLHAGLSTDERQQLAQRESELRQQLTAAEQRLEALPDAGTNPTSQVLAAAQGTRRSHSASPRRALPPSGQRPFGQSDLSRIVVKQCRNGHSRAVSTTIARRRPGVGLLDWRLEFLRHFRAPKRCDVCAFDN